MNFADILKKQTRPKKKVEKPVEKKYIKTKEGCLLEILIENTSLKKYGKLKN